jgi:hypothetical protein
MPKKSDVTLQIAEPCVGVVPAAPDVRNERLEVEATIELGRRQCCRAELHEPKGIGGRQLDASGDSRSLLEAANNGARMSGPEVDRGQRLAKGTLRHVVSRHRVASLRRAAVPVRARQAPQCRDTPQHDLCVPLNFGGRESAGAETVADLLG